MHNVHYVTLRDVLFSFQLACAHCSTVHCWSLIQCQAENRKALKICSTLDSFVVPAIKGMNPGPVAGASDDGANVDPESNAGESSEWGNGGNHLVSGSLEPLHSSSRISTSSLVGSLSTSTHCFFQTIPPTISAAVWKHKKRQRQQFAYYLLERNMLFSGTIQLHLTRMRFPHFLLVGLIALFRKGGLMSIHVQYRSDARYKANAF